MKNSEKSIAVKNRFNNAIDKVSSGMGKIGQQRHLSVLRDAFAYITPFIIVSGLAIVFLTIVFGGWGSMQSSIFGLIAHGTGQTITNFGSLNSDDTSWIMIDNNSGLALTMKYGQDLFTWIYQFGIGTIALLFAMAMGYAWAIQNNRNPLYYIFMVVGALTICTKAQIAQWGPMGIFTTMVVGLITLELFSWFETKARLQVKMPAGVPLAVARGFSQLFPIAIISTVIGLITFTGERIFDSLVASGSYTLEDILQIIFIAPFLSIANSGADIGLLFLYAFLATFFWFFGIHGHNTINGIFQIPMILLWVGNLNGEANVFTVETYNAFVMMPGMALPLAISLLVYGRKSKALTEMGKFAIGPANFNISEPLLFGVPIILNFKLFVPWVATSMTGCILATIAIKTGIVNPARIPFPWTFPFGLGALITTGMDWRAMVLFYIILVLNVLIYWPFIKWVARDSAKEEKALANATKAKEQFAQNAKVEVSK